MTRLIAALLLAATSLTCSAVDYLWSYQGLNLQGQYNWGFLTNADAPIPGAWQTQLLVTNPPTGLYVTNANSALVTNYSGNIAAGVYRAFVQIHSYDHLTNINLTLGAASTTNKVVDDRDYNKNWTDLGLITNAAPVDHLGLSIQRDTSGIRPLLYIVYLSGNLNLSITSDDFLTDLTVPTVMDTNAPIAGNNVRNSSFEVGVSGWSVNMNDRPFDWNSCWDTNVAFRGTSSLKIPITTGGTFPNIYSLPMRLRTNKVHTVSCYVKTDMAGFGARLSMQNVYTVPSGFATFPSPVTIATVTTNWTRMTATMTNWSYPYNEFEVLIAANNTPANGNFWIDAVQVEEGATANAYHPMEQVELGFRSEDPGHIHYTSEDHPLTLRLYNDGLPINISGSIEFFNNDQVRLTTTTFSFPLATNGVNYASYNITSLPLGAIRAVAWITTPGIPSVEEEYVFAHVSPPRTLAKDVSSMIGIHPTFRPFMLDSLTRLGPKWIRGLSPEAAFRWTFSEPIENSFVWFDTDMGYASNSIATVVANIGEQIPPYAQRKYFTTGTPTGSFQVGEQVNQGTNHGIVTLALVATNATGYALQLTNVVGLFASGSSLTGAISGAVATQTSVEALLAVALDKWDDHVAALVAHYVTNNVHWWEVWNEPNQKSAPNGVSPGNMPEFTTGVPALYAEVLMRAVRKIKAGDPTAHIVGFGGVISLAWMTNCWNMLDAYTKTNIDAVSVHLYDPNGAGAQSLVDGWTKVYGVPLWNSETGIWDYSYYSGANSNIRYQGTSLVGYRTADRFYRTWHIAPETLAINFSQTIGSGMTNAIYYDARPDRHLNYQNSNTSGVDYDGSPTAKLLALANIANLVEHGMGKGKFPITNLVEAYLFTNYVGVPFVSIWSQTREAYTIGLSTTNFTLLDMIGNPVTLTGSNVVAFRSPTFIIGGAGLSETTLSNAMMAATVTLRADTNAPLLAITCGPLGQISALKAHSFFWAWAGIDLRSLPDISFFDAMAYRWRIPTVNATWSQWSANAYLRIQSLPDGLHSLEVESKDEAGNVSSASRSFQLGSPAVIFQERLSPGWSSVRRRRL